MKLLRTLALLPLAAAASQAATIEFQFGKNNPVGSNSELGAKYNAGTLAGITVAGNISREIELGLNVNYKHLATDVPSGAEGIVGSTNLGVLNASLDLTYDLNPRGGISPFVGIGLGYAWLSNLNDSLDIPVTTSKGLFTASAYAGIRFALNKKLDFTLTARDTYYMGLKNSGVGENPGAKSNVQNWEAIAGLRYRF
jgi:opacity protein-like surface antigen